MLSVQVAQSVAGPVHARLRTRGGFRPLMYAHGGGRAGNETEGVRERSSGTATKLKRVSGVSGGVVQPAERAGSTFSCWTSARTPTRAQWLQTVDVCTWWRAHWE